MIKYIIGLSILIFSIDSYGQDGNIILKNSSFEDTPRQGVSSDFGASIQNWFDCGEVLFKSETPPDIHPGNFFSVSLEPFRGNSYLGLVVRDNDSWESVSQRLSAPIEGGKCYQFSIYLAKSDTYLSNSRAVGTNKKFNFSKPTTLRIWGGSDYCQNSELLAVSEPVDNLDWKEYTFEFNPENDHSFILLEAFYKTPEPIPYNGHILVDEASHIVRIPCPGEDYAVVAPPVKEKIKLRPKRKQTKPKEEPVVVAQQPSNHTNHNPETHSHKPKMILELDRKKIKKGQTINMENLYFAANESSINKASYNVLDELYNFLDHNQDVFIEIGGHTNGKRGISHAYCDKLSTGRAKTVADFLIERGIDESRVKHKGYGKRKPIATNTTVAGLRRNQRVEIKILNFGS